MKQSKSNNKASKLAVIGILAAATLTVTACQSSSPDAPVMMRSDSTYETTGLGETKVKAQNQALTNAKKKCGNREPVVLDNQVKYNGVLDERTGRMIEQVGSVASVVLGSKMPNISRSDDYEYTINFRCQ